MEGKESKSSNEGKGEDEEKDDLNEVAVAFMKFSMSEELTSISREFIAQNCDEFKDAAALAASGEGYPLAWSQLHREFCTSIDASLTRFCSEQGVTEEALYELLQDSMQGSELMSDYIPQFLKLFMDFDSFVAQRK